jgi:mRNA interferase HigB
MRVISRRVLRECCERHPDSTDALNAWYKHVQSVTWKTPDEFMRRYPYARPIEDNRVVFKIMGNKYRLVVRIEYDLKIVFIRFVGTHAEYDRIDAGTVLQVSI